MSIEYTFIFCEKPDKVENQTFDFKTEWPVEFQVGHAIDISVAHEIRFKLTKDNPLNRNLPLADFEKQVEELGQKFTTEESAARSLHPQWLLENDIWRIDHIYHRYHSDVDHQGIWVLVSPYKNHPCRR